MKITGIGADCSDLALGTCVAEVENGVLCPDTVKISLLEDQGRLTFEPESLEFVYSAIGREAMATDIHQA
jgi:hypothetical protein